MRKRATKSEGREREKWKGREVREGGGQKKSERERQLPLDHRRHHPLGLVARGD